MGIFSRSKKQSTTPPTRPAPPSAPLASTYNIQYVPPLPRRPVTSSSQAYGTLPSSGWPANPPPYAQLPGQPCQQIFVSNNFLLAVPQPANSASKGKKAKATLPSSSMIHLPQLGPLGPNIPSCIPGAHIFNDGIPQWRHQGTQYLNQGAALYELISSKFNSVMTSIDGESFSGNEQELMLCPPQTPQAQHLQLVTAKKGATKEKSKSSPKDDTGCPVVARITGTNYFAKVNLYANSRLPPNLPSMKIYVPTFPLLCIAARYSESVYTKPTGKEREAFVDADWRNGTKSMVIKSVPMDDRNVIVFAIRGSQTFLDWAVNLNSSPASPAGFLDDPGNFCHAGFLSVARKMVIPVAARLRTLLQEDPSRSACSLLITGHSAGGAVAALLYSHMLASSPETESELNMLTGCFKRIHCVTFGAPPVSLLPLAKPDRVELKKSVFFAFVNEGDPVARADKAYVRSLLELYAAPAPSNTNLRPATPSHSKSRPGVTGNKGENASSLTVHKSRPTRPTRSNSAPTAAPVWPVPPCILSNAGRIILLRGVPRKSYSRENGRKGLLNPDERMDDGVQARIVTDEQLREVVWGDPVCHMMTLYNRRIEVLATNAVVGRGWAY